MHVLLAAATFAGLVGFSSQGWSQAGPPPAPLPTGHGPSADDWAALAKLPDWSGIWQPDVLDQNRQAKENDYPWTIAAATEIDKRIQLEKDGKPGGSHNTCLPWGMPGFMAITHNTIEILFTPGRLTILGELDGNNLRRIYTDGRPHPKDGDLTYHGHSIGQWRGTGQTATLDVDTVDILPEVEIALSEGVGIPGGDGIHVVEHMHLVSTNVLADDMEITAPKVLDTTYKTRRSFFRRGWGPEWDIVEGVCAQGSYVDQVDPKGFAIFVPKERADQ
jgi:hypothetical protein